MAFVGAIIASIAIASIIVVTIVGFVKANSIEKDYDNKFKSVVSQMNEAQYYEYAFDKRNKSKLDAISGDVEKMKAAHELSAGKITSKKLDIAGNLKADIDHVEANKIRFSKNYTGYADSASDRAEIANDVDKYKKLVIAGNKSSGKGQRTVGILDRLDVHGDAVSTGWISGKNAHGRDNVVAGDWNAYLSGQGHVFAGGWVQGGDVTARNELLVGSNAWIRSDGTASLRSALSVGEGAPSPSDLSSQGWRAAVQNGNTGVRVANSDGSGMLVKGGNNASSAYGLRVENPSGSTFEVANDGRVTVAGTINNSKVNPGAMLERNYGSDSNRFGIGQWPNGATRVYAAASDPSTVSLSLAKANDAFDDVVTVTTSNVNVTKDLNVANKNLTAGSFKSANPASNWFHVYRGDSDQLLFGSDDANRGVMSVGDRPLNVYTKGQSRLSIDATGNRVKASVSNLVVGTSDDDGKNISLFSTGGDGAEMGGNYQGGLMSARGIGFKNRVDGATRFMHDTKTGDTTIAGKLSAGDVSTKGNVKFTGGNNWIIHAPNDNRRALYIAPSAAYNNDTWNWNAHSRIEADGNFFVANRLTSASNLCIGDVCLTKEELLKLKNA